MFLPFCTHFDSASRDVFQFRRTEKWKDMDFVSLEIEKKSQILLPNNGENEYYQSSVSLGKFCSHFDVLNTVNGLCHASLKFNFISTLFRSFFGVKIIFSQYIFVDVMNSCRQRCIPMISRFFVEHAFGAILIKPFQLGWLFVRWN